MTRVVIGMDPHKRSVTIEGMAPEETVLDGGRYATDGPGYAAMLRQAKQWPERIWAIEGCSGTGRHVATRLWADDEQVVDVPPKLSAGVRVFSTGQGRKTDATEAHSVALVGTRMAGLRPVIYDQQLAVLRVMADRRRVLGEDHTRMIARSTACCSNWFLAEPRRICRQHRPNRCGRTCDRGTPPARPAAGSPLSSSPTSSGSMRARRPQTRSCESSSRRPARHC
jgi:hypothetical protein